MSIFRNLVASVGAMSYNRRTFHGFLLLQPLSSTWLRPRPSGAYILPALGRTFHQKF